MICWHGAPRAEYLKARKLLYDAFEYLRPRMIGYTIRGIEPNGEAMAGSILAHAMVEVVGQRGQS